MAPHFDPREMGVLHSVYRREFGLAAGLVRDVENGDTTAATIVDQHFDLLESALVDHHQAEDEVIWPLLVQRVPNDLKPLVQGMVDQHQHLEALLGDLAAARRGWSREARRADGAELAQRYETFYHALVKHLDDEEHVVMPVAAEYLTLTEWRKRAKHSSHRKKLSKIPLLYGLMEYGSDPKIVAGMMPKSARIVLGRLGRRAFRRHALRVHGTATP